MLPSLLMVMLGDGSDERRLHAACCMLPCKRLISCGIRTSFQRLRAAREQMLKKLSMLRVLALASTFSPLASTAVDWPRGAAWKVNPAAPVSKAHQPAFKGRKQTY
eukprot:995841-Pleurochrysis_carterae.AAC.3